METIFALHKKIIQFISPVVFLLFITSCKKDAASAPEISSLSFNYNGKPYTLRYTTDGVQDWGAESNSLYINRKDIFGGIIRFNGSGCAYMEPYEGAVYPNANCELTSTSRMPVDSAVVYTYQSGSMALIYSNCETKRGIDFTTGAATTYRICDGIGSFTLVLKNKEDKHITITNGVIKLYNIKM